MNNGDSPAFAAGAENWNQEGLSKREYFAAMAMQGFLSSYSGASADPSPHHAALKSVEYADALIEALNRQKGGEK